MFRGTTAPRRRRLTLLLAAAGTAATIGLAGQPAQAATTEDPAEAAAGWLADQLIDGERFESEFGPDPGLALDALLAFAATETAGDHADSVLSWLAEPEVMDIYLGSDGERYAGSYAKLAFTVDLYGQDAASFGGVDLLAELRDLEADNGQFRDESSFGDFSGSFSQSYAILVLMDTPEGVSAAAVDRLVAEQCADGGFPQPFGEDSCDPGVDTTAVAAAALLATGQEAAAQSALDWLTEVQEPNGGFRPLPTAADEPGPVNANSTGLAGQVLREGGREAEADAAAAFLGSLQVGCDGPASERGAIHHNEDEPADLERATSQGVLGLAGVGLADLDGTTAQPEAPRLDCDQGSDPSPEPTETPPPAGGEAGEQLPVTGGPVLPLAGAGVLLLGAGGAAVWATQRRRRSFTEPTA